MSSTVHGWSRTGSERHCCLRDAHRRRDPHTVASGIGAGRRRDRSVAGTTSGTPACSSQEQRVSSRAIRSVEAVYQRNESMVSPRSSSGRLRSSPPAVRAVGFGLSSQRPVVTDSGIRVRDGRRGSIWRRNRWDRLSSRWVGWIRIGWAVWWLMMLAFRRQMWAWPLLVPLRLLVRSALFRNCG